MFTGRPKAAGYCAYLSAITAPVGLGIITITVKPFTTSKDVGLGISLSICVSLMMQMNGELRLASTPGRNACVVLQFNLTDVNDVE